MYPLPAKNKAQRQLGFIGNTKQHGSYFSIRSATAKAQILRSFALVHQLLMKQAIVRLALLGLIPASMAHWMINALGLRGA